MLNNRLFWFYGTGFIAGPGENREDEEKQVLP